MIIILMVNIQEYMKDFIIIKHLAKKNTQNFLTI